MIFEVAHWMGLAPLVWLALLRVRGRSIGVEWYWLAGVFAVSWLADTAAHWGNSWLVGLAYPVSQAAIVGLVLLSRREGLTLIITLVIVGVVDVLWFGIESPDILLRTVAWGAISVIAYRFHQLGRLRASLLAAFYFGLLAWIAYVIWPGWTSWSLYQSTRLLGILLFCWAATSPLPHFKLSRR